MDVPYSTLTRWVARGRAAQPAAARRRIRLRAGPGDAARHLAAPRDVRTGRQAGHGSSAPALVLAYSRRLFIQYYPRFTRFEAKAFLLEAARFMDGVCPRCIIDNTSVLLAAGAGADAVIAPEMAAFARTLGFRFLAHRVGNPDRKGRIERPFAYVENNFLAGRQLRRLSTTSTARRSLGAATSPTPSPSGAGHVARGRLAHRAAAPAAAARRAAAGLRVARTRRRSPRLRLGRHQSIFGPRALCRQGGHRLQDCPAEIEVRRKGVDGRRPPAGDRPARCAQHPARPPHHAGARRAAARPPRWRCCAAIMTASTAIAPQAQAARPRPAAAAHCAG